MTSRGLSRGVSVGGSAAKSMAGGGAASWPSSSSSPPHLTGGGLQAAASPAPSRTLSNGTATSTGSTGPAPEPGPPWFASPSAGATASPPAPQHGAPRASPAVLRGREALRVRAGVKVRRGWTRRPGADGVGGRRLRRVRVLGGGVAAREES
eukprot:6978324-Alexandrium_andersonii.AAC.1